ncbi:DUF2306 domain-containing protein [Shinella sp.]|uniref:DUF2306 domain-containing protein n=1 Tax=Shinella sp. TaxID=1870904 RepID=UPI003F70CD5B
MLKSTVAISRFVLLWILCPLVAIASFRFLLGGVEVTMADFVYHANLRPVAFYAHIVLASVALALVPVQLWPGLRQRRITLHRTLGRVYAISILASGAGGFFLAVGTESGAVAASGFACLAIAWVGTTVYGVILAMTGDVAAHRRWMIRSAALTMAAVTLRIYLGLSVVAGLSYDEVAGALAWGCWIPNLLLAEVILRRSKPGQQRAGFRPAVSRG